MRIVKEYEVIDLLSPYMSKILDKEEGIKS